MRILIAGATGLIGGSLIRECLSRNIDVNFLTTRKEKIDSIPNAQGFYWNPKSGEIDTNCFQDVDAVINLAGTSIASRWTKTNKENILNSRIQSLDTLYKGIEQHGTDSIHSFVSASAIGIYPHSYTTYYTEKETETSEGFAGQVVKQWEESAARLSKLVPKLALVRIGLVLSDEGGALPKMASPVRSFAGAAFGSGEQWQSWIHIDDLAKMFLFLIDNELEGIYNAVAPNPVTQKKLIKEIAKVLDKPLILPNVPQFVLRLMLGEMSEILISSQRVSSKKIESLGFDFQYLNVCLALESLYKKKEPA